jgi:predicted nuclease with TOPRIM domain
LELLKKGYDADIKILQGTIEEQRLRSQDIAQRNQKIIDDFGQLSKENDEMRAQLKEKEQFAAEFADIKKQSNQFLQEKQSILDEFTKKQEEITQLRMTNAELKQQSAD